MTQSSCQLFGFVGVVVQIFLGILSFGVLFYKRYRQHPKRPWKIWFMDTSKQAVSQFLAHCLNVVISLKLSLKLDNDACIWYFATIILDTTVGMLICIGILRLLQIFIFQGSYSKYQSGNYYQIEIPQGSVRSEDIQKPVQIQIINYKTWIMQFLIWNSIVVIMKSILFIIQDKLSKPIMRVSMFLMGWITKYPNLQLVIVMFVIPVIMNAIAFWIQDNFLMKKNTQIQQQKKSTEKMEKSELKEENSYNQRLLNTQIMQQKQVKRYELKL